MEISWEKEKKKLSKLIRTVKGYNPVNNFKLAERSLSILSCQEASFMYIVYLCKQTINTVHVLQNTMWKDTF